jgi:ribulose-phosphate 3-epimerase
MIGKTRIVPAVLTDDFAVLQKMFKQAETFTDYLQVDVMDGEFVPSKSITYNDLLKINTSIEWEAHLMVNKPESYLDGFKKAGARRIIFHFEATDSHADIISRIRKLGLEVGLAVNPETPASSFLSFADTLDSVLFMTVHPGFYGAKFLLEVLDKIVDFRRQKPDIEIGADGGVKEDNLIKIAQSGVNNLCVGSAIFMRPDPGQAYREMTSLLSVNK